MGESTTSKTLAFTTVRSATGVDFIGTSGVDVGVIFDETGNVTLSGLGDGDVIQVNNSTLIQRTTSINGGDGADQITFNTSISDSSINGNMGVDTIVLYGSVAVIDTCFGLWLLVVMVGGDCWL